MRKLLIAAAMLALAGQAGAVTVQMTGFHQRSSSGTLSTLRWDGCTDYGAHTNCINPASYMGTSMGMTPSTAVWDWNAGTGVLSMTGMFNAASSLGSSGAPPAPVVIGDRVTNLTIDTVNDTTTAASYNCLEGNFLAGVGANGCLNTSLGGNFTNESSAVYNIGGVASCMQRTLGGDDASTGNPRGLTTQAGGGGCDPTDGAFDLWTVVQDSGGTLIVSNGIDLASAGTSYATFSVVPVPGAVWLMGSAVGLLGLVRRRLAA